MYIRRTHTTNSATGERYTTHRLVQSERVGGRVRQVTLLNLGRQFTLPQEEWPALCARLEELLSRFLDVSEVALISRLKPGETFRMAPETLDCLLDTLTEALLSGKRIELRGFCTMWPVRRGTRRAYSPIGKRVYKLDAHWTVRFTVGKTVKRALMEHLEE